MPKDIESRLKSIEEKVESNNRMLHKIRRREILGFWFGILKLLVIIGVFYYGYVFVEPYLKQLLDMFATVQELKNDSVNLDFNGINVPEFLKGLGQ